MQYSNNKITFDKYKDKTFLEAANEIINNNPQYISTIGKTIISSKTNEKKKKELQNFLEFFHKYFNETPHFSPPPLSPPPQPLLPQPPIMQNIKKEYLNQICIQNISENVTHIIHISDIHIRLYNRQKEYTDIFQKLFIKINDLLIKNPSQIIIITGDLLHSKNILSPESILITQQFLQKLASMATTFLIAGNHDALLTNNQREDSITAITKNMDIPNFYYLKYSGIYNYNNISIIVNSIIDNKWIYASDFIKQDHISHTIALYHGCVGLCETGVGHRLRGEKLIEDFDGYDYVLLGDIHKFQFLDEKQKRIAYASSLIAQNFNEWNNPHGILQWDLFSQDHIYHEIPNNCGFFVFNLYNDIISIENTVISIENIPQYIKHIESSLNLKLNINKCSQEFISRINYIVKNTVKDVRIINNYVTDNVIEIKNEFMNSQNVQTMTHIELITQYLTESYKTISNEDIQFILNKYNDLQIDAEILHDRELAHWDLIDIEFSNLFGYGADNYINFARFNSQTPIGIIAPNSHGKSSLIDIILFTLFTKFSRTRGTGISKDIININCNNFKTKIQFKIGAEKYIIIKEGKREQTDKIKITKNEFYKIGIDNITIQLTDEDRKKTDKVITNLIGSYDDFIFTNVQLQNNTNSFKEMTDKERKEYLYKVLKLNVWNDIIKTIGDQLKPLRSSILFLEKSTENKSNDDYIFKIEKIKNEIELIEKKLNETKKEKLIIQKKVINNCSTEKYNINEILAENEKLAINLSKKNTEISIIETKINELNNQLDKLTLIKRQNEIQQKYTEESLDIPPFISIQHLLKKINADPKEIISKIKITDYEKKELENLKKSYEEYYTQKIENSFKLYQISNKDEIILKTEIINYSIEKYNTKIKKLKKINNKLEILNDQYKLCNKKNDILIFLKDLESHEYDPNCKFCIKHPIVKQKKEKEDELTEILKLIPIELESITIKEKIDIKNEKKISLESTIAKIDIEFEENKNIKKLKDEINRKISDNVIILSQIEKFDKICINTKERIKTLETNIEHFFIATEIIEIENKNILQKKFEESTINNEWILLEKQLKSQSELKLQISNQTNTLDRYKYEIKDISEKIEKNNLLIIQINQIKENKKILDEIEEIDIIISKCNKTSGVLNQQLQNLTDEYNDFQQKINELKDKKNEYRLIQILEQTLGKDGLPLKILNKYLSPIANSINCIIAPFISRKINIHLNNDDLILDSFPSNDATKSVFMHGGMESFILDIAFKITLSNFAKLPKCNILFLDEGISAFDNERLNNISMLFNFIRNYFSKTILITHIDSVKENINEKISIIKDELFSKIICEYL